VNMPLSLVCSAQIQPRRVLDLRATAMGAVPVKSNQSGKDSIERDTAQSDDVTATVLSTGMGHVWTAPWQELSDVAAALVGCGHVSGLFMRPVWPRP
jgi:hypothetical protein